MIGICSIFRYVLRMTPDSMFCITSIRKLCLVWLNIKEIKLWLFSFIDMKPKINKTMNFFDMILPKFGRFFFSMFPFEIFTFIVCKVITVLDIEYFGRFVIVVNTNPSLSIIEPSMEGTLYTFLVDNFAPDTHISSKMCAVGV